MSSRTFDGNPESAGSGFCPAPPPPPPPPVPGQVPALRINTVEAPTPRRSLPNSNNNPYEPPAAIQNAMMTKDKKPFTYTPGMGGKLDLSQIRSPRMARRVAKNANDEGIEGPPKSSLAAEPRPVSAAPNLYIQPQVAVPVFPTNVPLQPSANRTPSAPTSRVPSNASDRAVEIQRPITRVETKMVPVSPQPAVPETPTTPPQVTLAKAPTPWLQNKNKPQEELPEWAKRSSVIRPSSSTSPESPGQQTAQIQMQPTQVTHTIQLQQPPSPPIRQQQQPAPPPRQQSQPQERVIPLRIEDRPSVFSVKNEPGHHQFKQQQQPQPSPHHQQRWGNPTPPQTPIQAPVPQYHNQNHQQPSRPQSSGGGTYIVPIMVEGSTNNGPATTSYNQQQPIQARNQPVQNQSPRVIVQRGPPSPQIQQQGEPGPVQSRSFRVLQKITSTDTPDEVDGEQMRKLQLTEDDKLLMNKFKEQGRQWVDLCTDETSRGWQQPADRDGSYDHTFLVDGDGTYLHQEEDPRYRGAAIPSRAFRFLQNMTDSGDVTTTANAPRAPSAINKRQNRNSRTFEESQANLPASEQQAPEPKKYTGSAIPSRSFRILQAMTSPESIAKQENRQAVIICRTDTSMQPGNQQQGVFLSASSPHDSSLLPLAQQSQLPSQFHTSHLQSSQLQATQSQHSQSSDKPSSQLQQYEAQLSQTHMLPLKSLDSQSSSPQLTISRIQLIEPRPSHFQSSPLQETSGQDKLQLSQSHPSQMPMIPPPFWQNLEGNCWWGYYPIPCPIPSNATSSPSSISSTSANNHSPTSHNLLPTPYESYAYYTGCHLHHHQDGNAFAYYHPFYDQRLYAAAPAAKISAATATGISPSDADSLKRCTDSQSSSLNEGTSAEVSNVLVSEDSSSCSQLLFASTPPTILHQATAACLVPSFIHHQPTKTLPGYDSSCNPCLERTERSCAGETTIFKCPPVYMQNPAQGLPGCRGLNGWTKDQEQGTRHNWIGQDPALTEPGPPPWIQNDKNQIENSLCSNNNRAEMISNENKSEVIVEQDDAVGWNVDGSIGSKENSAGHLPDEQIMGTNLKVTKTGGERSPQPDWHFGSDNLIWDGHNVDIRENQNAEQGRSKWKQNKWEAILVDQKSEDDRAKWTRNNFGADRVDQKIEEAVPRLNKNSMGSTGHSVGIEEPKWNRIDNASRNFNDIDPSIPMNILHEERNVNESPVVDKVKNNDSQYFDRSEDANATDLESETDSSSSDSSVDAEPVCTDPATNTEDDSDSESDSDDSDSYLAYSTGLNPHNKFSMQPSSTAIPNRLEKEFRKSQTATTISEDAFDERSFAMSSDRLNSSDCESCAEEEDVMEEDAKIEVDQNTNFDQLKADDITPHRLSVIPEDSEQNDRGGASPNAIGSDGWQNVPEDNNADATIVSVSLPLRSRSSVLVNDANIGECTESTDVCVNLKLVKGTNTSVDFTLTKNISQEVETKETNELEEDDRIDFWSTEEVNSERKDTGEQRIVSEKEEKSQKEISNETNDDIISNSDTKTLVTQDDCIDFWETITSGRVTPDLNYHSKREKRIDRFFWGEADLKEEKEEDENKTDDEKNIKEESIPSVKIDDSRCSQEQEEVDEVDVEEHEESEDEEGPEEETMQMSEENEELPPKNVTTPLFELTEAKSDENEESSGRSNLENSKHLLSVQNSRDETDDEDSGVTSDMSRLISEVDTDSECGPTRKINSYKRTQTHSRLFRLLSREDDVQVSEEMKNNSARRDRLSLPLKSTGFSYDESHHCSNYSSGLTSPDYSPVYESTWRKLHNEENGTTDKPQSPTGLRHDDESSKNRKDPYYENWKKTVTEEKILEEKIITSKALNIVENGAGCKLPNWRFRANVLCPRIKSTKNVPRTVRTNRSAKPVISSPSTSNSVGKSNDNAI